MSSARVLSPRRPRHLVRGQRTWDLPAHDRRHDPGHPGQRARLLLARPLRQADADATASWRSGEIVVREVIPDGAVPGSGGIASSSRSATATSRESISAGSTSPPSPGRSSRSDAVYVERREYGPFIGMVTGDPRGRPGHRRRAPMPHGRRFSRSSRRRRRTAPPSGDSSATRSAASTISSNGSGCGSASWTLRAAVQPGAGPDGRARAALAARSRACRPRTRMPRRQLAQRQAEASRTRVLLVDRQGRGEGACQPRRLPGLSRERADDARRAAHLRLAASGSSCPATRASRTPRGASSRLSSGPS